MLRIGDFSKKTGISIDMLRHYDKIGIIKPNIVDENNYRYYHEEQVLFASYIVTLKNNGFTLSEIRDILSDSTILEYSISKKIEEKTREISNYKKQIKDLKIAQKNIENIFDTYFAINIKKLPKMKILSLRETIDDFRREGELWEKLLELLDKKRIKKSNYPFRFTNYYLIDFEKKEFDCEVCISVDESNQKAGVDYSREIDERLVASLSYKGPYSQIGRYRSVLYEFLDTKNYKRVGVPFSIYHLAPDDEKNENKLVTEECIEIK